MASFDDEQTLLKNCLRDVCGEATGFHLRFIRKNSRTIIVRVREDCGISISAPFHAPLERVIAFLRQRAVWLRSSLARMVERSDNKAQRKCADGSTFYFRGEARQVVFEPANGSPFVLEARDKSWVVRCQSGTQKNQDAERMIRLWYQRSAKDLLPARVKSMAESLELSVTTVVIRSQRRIWGSCNFRTKTINLNWQIVCFPDIISDYIIIHELCHLRHPDHSRRFWGMVRNYCPDYKAMRRWLKDEAHKYTLPF